MFLWMTWCPLTSLNPRVQVPPLTTRSQRGPARLGRVDQYGASYRAGDGYGNLGRQQNGDHGSLGDGYTNDHYGSAPSRDNLNPRTRVAFVRPRMPVRQPGPPRPVQVGR